MATPQGGQRRRRRAEPPVGVQIVGMRQFMAELAALGPAVNEQFKRVNFEVAEKVRLRAQAEAFSQGSTARKAGPSLRTVRRKTSSVISLGGARAPYAGGAEYGSDRYRQFKPWRGNQWKDRGPDGVGYFLQPTIRDMAQDIEKMYGDAFDKLARGVFPFP